MVSGECSRMTDKPIATYGAEVWIYVILVLINQNCYLLKGFITNFVKMFFECTKMPRSLSVGGNWAEKEF